MDSEKLGKIIEGLTAIFAESLREMLLVEVNSDQMTDGQAERIINAVGERYFAALTEVQDRVNAHNEAQTMPIPRDHALVPVTGSKLILPDCYRDAKDGDGCLAPAPSDE